MTMMTFLTAPRRLPQAIVLVSAAILFTVNVFEYGFGYLPCQLCLYQRLPWWIALGIGCVALMTDGKRRDLATLLSILALIAIAVGAGIGFYHAGVEYKFWAGPSGCSGTQELSGGLAAAIQSVSEGPKGPSCGEPAWTLFGVSMAGYNFLVSLIVVVIGGLAAKKRLRTA
ncbi:disulfide bond formation protein B [Rhodospirillaceae bacterium KN72]|uniref:Disulfide bond formation protein B n=1 Tax=Pacificispira spongiicola TaxID=2729598 RepID=A0A7Y0E250_9PROT|nr:disulfide bond formation protein B [Pacificispira spongiicola]NMM45852.1 disulfide bond formation protein B [Pacificispira spongiicola]